MSRTHLKNSLYQIYAPIFEMGSKMDKAKIKKFKRTVWKYYRENGRSFPWRKTKDPYKILVSEIMLQQTQTERVVSKYKEFIKKFPTIESLDEASLSSVLGAWQGLGYNRRALHLKVLAREVVLQFDGTLPRDEESLLRLPGVGQSTAGALRAFAWNERSLFIETNIRTVFIHFFFPRKKKVLDANLLPFIKAAVDSKESREWYWALMDYGVMLKKKYGNTAARRSAHYGLQSPFEGSNRQKRAGILRILLDRPSSVSIVSHKIKIPRHEAENILKKLSTEGFVFRRGLIYRIAKKIA